LKDIKLKITIKVYNCKYYAGSMTNLVLGLMKKSDEF